MIDIEDIVFDRVAKTLAADFPNISVSSSYVESPSKFPHVSITQANNYVVRGYRTDKIENAVTVMFEINVYSNRVGDKKSECKKIMSVADEAMESMGFTRTMLNPIPNIADATIYRLVARYSGDVDVEKNGDDEIYIVYQN